MRNLIKYKLFSKKILDVVPAKVIAFKKSKWLRSKQFINQKLQLIQKKTQRKKAKVLKKSKQKFFYNNSFKSKFQSKLSLKKRAEINSTRFFGKLKLKLLLRLKLSKKERVKNKTYEIKKKISMCVKKKESILSTLGQFRKSEEKENADLFKLDSKALTLSSKKDGSKKNDNKSYEKKLVKSDSPRFFVSNRKMFFLKRRHKTVLESRNIVKQFFGISKINSKSTKHLKNFDSIYRAVFLKQFYRVEVLLWKLNFFRSSKEAMQYLVHGKVLVNGLKKSGNYFLKKGDIITISVPFQDSCFDNKKILENKIFLKKSFFPFVEVDFFTKTIIILKDHTELSSLEYSFFTPFFFNISFLDCFK